MWGEVKCQQGAGWEAMDTTMLAFTARSPPRWIVTNPSFCRVSKQPHPSTENIQLVSGYPVNCLSENVPSTHREGPPYVLSPLVFPSRRYSHSPALRGFISPLEPGQPSPGPKTQLQSHVLSQPLPTPRLLPLPTPVCPPRFNLSVPSAARRPWGTAPPDGVGLPVLRGSQGKCYVSLLA